MCNFSKYLPLLSLGLIYLMHISGDTVPLTLQALQTPPSESSLLLLSKKITLHITAWGGGAAILFNHFQMPGHIVHHFFCRGGGGAHILLDKRWRVDILLRNWSCGTLLQKRWGG